MTRTRTIALLTLAAAAAAGSAHADVVLLDAGMYGSIQGTNNATVGMVNFASAAGNFVVKTVYGSSGLGITGGRTADEIDVGESITLSWAGALTIRDFAVSVLFNGPEYNDWAEVAQVSAYNGVVLVGTGVLQVDATSDHLATFAGTGFGSVGNVSLADDSHGGSWWVSNPFGSAAVNRLVFTALDSSLCGRARCGNQSDYTLSSVTAVPEPGSLPLTLAALGLCGFVVRRARAKG